MVKRVFAFVVQFRMFSKIHERIGGNDAVFLLAFIENIQAIFGKNTGGISHRAQNHVRKAFIANDNKIGIGYFVRYWLRKREFL